MKKLILFFIVGIVVLSGCRSGDTDPDATEESSPTPAQEVRIEKPEFTIMLPTAWREIAAAEFPEVILNKNPVAVFRKIQADAGEFPNIVITSQTIPPQITPLEFSRSIRENESATLPDFQQVELKQAEISGQATEIFQFSARSTAENRILNFSQTFLTDKGTGYVFTAATGQQASEQTKAEIYSIFTSVSIK